MKLCSLACLIVLLATLAQQRLVKSDEPAPVSLGDLKLDPLFPNDGHVTKGWTVREWDDVSEPPHKPVKWTVNDGVLHGTGGLPNEEWIGTWLLSEQEYENFVVDFDFHLDEDWGNGGFAIRAPLDGDPAMVGMELQLTEPHYQFNHFAKATPEQLTGAIYLAIAPKKQVYKPNDWNHQRMELRGASLRAWLNDDLIQVANLDEVTH